MKIPQDDDFLFCCDLFHFDWVRQVQRVFKHTPLAVPPLPAIPGRVHRRAICCGSSALFRACITTNVSAHSTVLSDTPALERSLSEPAIEGCHVRSRDKIFFIYMSASYGSVFFCQHVDPDGVKNQDRLRDERFTILLRKVARCVPYSRFFTLSHSNRPRSLEAYGSAPWKAWYQFSRFRLICFMFWIK